MSACLTLKQSHTSLSHCLASSIVLSDVRLQPKGMVILATTSFAPVPGFMWKGQQILQSHGHQKQCSLEVLKCLETSSNNLKGKQPGVCCAFQALPTKAAQQRFLTLLDPVLQIAVDQAQKKDKKVSIWGVLGIKPTCKHGNICSFGIFWLYMARIHPSAVRIAISGSSG